MTPLWPMTAARTRYIEIAVDGTDCTNSQFKDFDVLDVDFEWFDPQPEFDFHGIKTLLQQLFDVDAQLFDLSALTDLILAQPTLGSTVKVDGNETDAYAFLSVINLQEHKVGSRKQKRVCIQEQLTMPRTSPL